MAQPKAKPSRKGKNMMAAIADMLRQKAMRQPPQQPQMMPGGGAAPSPMSMMPGAGMPPGGP